nr:transposase [Streptomyces bicolor]
MTRALREFIAANAYWLTVIRVPTHAPGLNATEGLWPLIKRDIGNSPAPTSARSPAQSAEVSRACSTDHM